MTGVLPGNPRMRLPGTPTAAQARLIEFFITSSPCRLPGSIRTNLTSPSEPDSRPSN